MQDKAAPKKRRNYSGRVYRPRQCQDCQETFTPQSSGQKLCTDCRERRNALPPIRVIPERACQDCGATFTPQKSVSRRCMPCQDQRTRMLRLESCRRKRAERRGDDAIVRYCADCGTALPGTSAKCCQDCRLARLQRDLERREEREQAAETRRRERPPPRPRQPKPTVMPAPKLCADCGATLPPDGRRKRCDPCWVAHEQVTRRARNGRQRARHVPKPPRTDWLPTKGLELRACTACSEEFQPYRSNQFECSYRCRDAVGRIRAHGLTPEQHDAMLAEQGGVCALCGNAPYPRSGVPGSAVLNIDHDHATGLVRGLLCPRCNLGLGGFADDPELLRRAAEYVERYAAAPLAT